MSNWFEKPKEAKKKAMNDDSKIKLWEVKDVDGEKYKVMADNCECGGNGLKFYQEKEMVAWFIRWANYRLMLQEGCNY